MLSFWLSTRVWTQHRLGSLRSFMIYLYLTLGVSSQQFICTSTHTQPSLSFHFWILLTSVWRFVFVHSIKVHFPKPTVGWSFLSFLFVSDAFDGDSCPVQRFDSFGPVRLCIRSYRRTFHNEFRLERIQLSFPLHQLCVSSFSMFLFLFLSYSFVFAAPKSSITGKNNTLATALFCHDHNLFLPLRLILF